MKIGHFMLAGAAVAAAMALVAPSFAAESKDAGHNKDYRTFYQGGRVDFGKIGDSYTADLVLYLAGNQFMVMEELVKDFLKKHPGVKNVYVETIPPGQIFNGQILKQGKINGIDTARNPDVFASVNLGHLKKLNEKGLISRYQIYTHNKLELMIASGNPKGIKGAEDLGRDDLVQSHPNPLTEGIFKFYGSAMLKDLKLYEKVTANKMCKSCWAKEGKTWFTSRHHRETPDRIEKGEADVGIVWTTEIIEAKKHGRKIDGVAIPAPLNRGSVVGYAIGVLNSARNQNNGYNYLAYLRTGAAQNIYGKYGFVSANEQELALKPAAKSAPASVKVAKGDTLGLIARRHGVPLADILAANSKILDANAISIGQELSLSPSDIPDHRVVIHVDDNDKNRMNMALNNASNVTKYYAGKGQTVKIDIVAYGPGLHMLRADTSPVKDRIKSFGESFDNIAFRACGNTLKKMSVKKQVVLLSQAKIVPSGVVHLMERQSQGWAYVRP